MCLRGTRWLLPSRSPVPTTINDRGRYGRDRRDCFTHGDLHSQRYPLPPKMVNRGIDPERPGWLPSRGLPYLVAPTRNRAASGGFAANVDLRRRRRPPAAGLFTCTADPQRVPADAARATGHLGNPLTHDLPDAVGAERRGNSRRNSGPEVWPDAAR